MTAQEIETNSPEAQSAALMADNIAKLNALFPELLTETTQGSKTTATLDVEVLIPINQAVNGQTRELRVGSVVNHCLTTTANSVRGTKTRPWAAASMH